ncbi:MAG: DNA polymerase III subunit delta [Bacteroidetes bacterium]|nr:DNA polymerase III subunit delta [Bacteroidota bacterium]
MAATHQVAHALLFAGVDGAAQLPLALAFAQYILCKNRNEDDSCNQCPSCLKINKLAHPDVHFVFPITPGKNTRVSDDALAAFRESVLHFPYLNAIDWGDALEAKQQQLAIAAEESLGIIKKLSYTSYEGHEKIMLIWLPEKMNTTAANKILKILEEPPNDTFFFLISNAGDTLLPTIISRTQFIKVALPSPETLSEVISSMCDVTSEAAMEAAHLAQNNPREAWLLTQTETAEPSQNLELFKQFMRACFKFDASKVIESIDVFDKLGRIKQQQFLLYSLHLIRNSLLFKHAPTAFSGTTEEKDFLQKFHLHVGLQNYERFSALFSEACYHIERNGNSKIIMMDLSFKINELLIKNKQA